jgi:MFS superfamily sulfate permease-like transporter
MMAVVSGIVCILAGIARLGFITELLSKPIRYGYMNGIALTVLISQLPKLFGFSIESDGPLRNLWAIAEAIVGGKTNLVAFAIGAGSLAVILALKISKRIPGILVAVAGATVIVGALDLGARAGVSVLGPLPQGLPAFAIPRISSTDVVPVLIAEVPSAAAHALRERRVLGSVGIRDATASLRSANDGGSVIAMAWGSVG